MTASPLFAPEASCYGPINCSLSNYLLCVLQTRSRILSIATGYVVCLLIINFMKRGLNVSYNKTLLYNDKSYGWVMGGQLSAVHIATKNSYLDNGSQMKTLYIHLVQL